jgi:carbon-monoxide dehydrogenase large subunit
MVESKGMYIGRYVPKIDDPLLLTGKGVFVDDINLPNMVYVGFLRSPYAHAVIKRIDAKDATSLRGVLGVFTGYDLKKMLKPYPPFFKDFPGLKYAECYPLAVDKVRFVGEPVVAVVAEDRYILQDAIELIDVQYEPLPVVTGVEQAMREGSPLIYPEWGDNIMFRFTVKGGDINMAFDQADYIIKEKIEIHRYTGTPLEPRGYVAKYDPVEKYLTIWASTQQPHPFRTMISIMLDFPENKIRVIQPNVGGGFGLKTPVYPEEGLIPFLAMKLNRPVKWIETRREHMVATGHARQQTHYLEVACKNDGTVLGIKDKMIVDLGVFFPTHGQMQMYVTAKHIVGPYKIKHVYVDGYGVATNKTYYYAYRGFGKEAANLVYERIMDLVAKKLQMDRVEVRLKNLIKKDEFPYKTPTGAVYDSGDYETVLKKAVEISGYHSFKFRKEEEKKKGHHIGIGISFVLEPSGASVPDSYTQGYDVTTIRMDPSGKVVVLTGITSPGTGNETAIAQVVADQLGMSINDIEVVQGDTAVCPYGLGNFSSRAAIVGVSSAVMAARELRSKILKVAAHLLEASTNDLEIHDSKVFVKDDPSRNVSFRDIASYVYKNIYLLPDNIEPGLEVTKYFKTPNVYHIPDEEGRINTYPIYPYAVNIAVVEVETDTGVVKILEYYVVSDCGTIINPKFVEGQIVGGIAQGIGGALYEELVYDENGSLLTSSFMDYLIPSSLEIPNIQIFHHITPSPYTLLGSKGAGEGGAEGVSSVLISAVEDALEDYNIKITKTPLKPDYIYRLTKII